MHRVRTGRSACSAARRKRSRSPANEIFGMPSTVCSCMPVCGPGEGSLPRRLQHFTESMLHCEVSRLRQPAFQQILHQITVAELKHVIGRFEKFLAQ